MKNTKTSLLLILAAIAAASAMTLLIVASCTRQEEFQTGEGMTFTAVIDEGLTKTALNGLNVEWISGDCINVNGGVFSATPGNPATKATFKYVKGTVSEPPYKAFYPEGLVDSRSGKTILPSTLTYREGRLDTPMYAESDNENLYFRNICGVLCFSLSGSGTLKNITILANEPVSGPFDVLNSNGDFKPVGGDKMYNTLAMDCGSGIELGTSAKNFYFSLPPQHYSPEIEVIITGANGKEVRKFTSGDINILRNTLYTVNWEIDLSDSTGPSPIIDDKAYYDIAGNTNFWRNSEVRLEKLFYSDDNWVQLPDPAYEWYGKDKKDFKVTIPAEIGGEEWQGQNQFVIEHNMEASKLYDFCVTLHSAQSGTATVKLGHKTDHSGNFVFEDKEVNLTAGQDFIFKMPNISPQEDYEGVALILDFGRIPGGADVEIKNVCLQEHQAPKIMPEILPGVFTVGPGQDKTFGTGDDVKVNFLRGNLWWKESDNSWHIEDYQYDVPEKYDREHLGLFYYFADAELSNYGTKDITKIKDREHEPNLYENYGAIDDNNGYAANANWGIPYGKGHTLTFDEWGYLLSFDKNKSQYLIDDDPDEEDYALAKDYSNKIRDGKFKEKVNVVGHTGMLLVPDNWDLTGNPLKESYSADEWKTAEANGAVFLPYVCGFPTDGTMQIMPSPEYPDMSIAYFYCQGLLNKYFVVLSNMLSGKDAVMLCWYNWDMPSSMRLVEYVK